MNEEMRAPSRSARRNRLLVGAAAAMAACAMVAVTVERSGASLGAGNDSVELETVLGKKLPSWLDTGDVKLMPLSKLVHEREVDTKLKEGQAELREGKKKTQQLAYDNAAHPAKKGLTHEKDMAAVHKLAAEKKGSPAKVSAPVHVHHVAGHDAADAAEASTKPASASAHKGSSGEKKKAASTTTVESGSAALGEKKITDDLATLKADAAKEAAKEAAFKKHEVHVLAEMRAKAHAEEGKVEKNIEEVETEERNNEKLAIKAQMAKVEADEAKKIADMKAADAERLKLYKQQMKSVDTESSSEIKESKAIENALKAKETGDLKKAAAEGKKEASDAKAAVAKKGVEEAKVAKGGSSGGSSSMTDAQKKAIKDSVKHAAHTRLAKKASKAKGCTTDDCSETKVEDSNVDSVAEKAKHGSKEAIKKMRKLQKQITTDFHHVTSFAEEQKHALGPAPKIKLGFQG